MTHNPLSTLPMRRFINSAVLVLAFASVAVSRAGIAQPPASGTFITMLGKDTVAVEQYTRTAEALIGDYVTRPGQAVVNHYTVHFLADGNPGHVILSQTLANGATIPGAPKGVQLTIGATESVIAIERDTMINRKFAMSKTFPLLGTSFGMLELAFARLRAEHTDSGTFPGLPLDSKVQPDPIPVKFFGADSARFWNSTGAVFLRVDQTGKISGLSGRATSSPFEGRRVATLDMKKLIAGFAAADAAGKGVKP